MAIERSANLSDKEKRRIVCEIGGKMRNLQSGKNQKLVVDD